MIRKLIHAVMNWLDERTEMRRLIREEVTEKVVPKHRGRRDYMGCFGGLSLVFFGLQVVSGIFLLMHYSPHPEHAFESVQHISNDVAFGWLVRRVHAIGASFMVVLVLFHMFRVVYTGAYKPPRELHWISGFILLNLTLAMGFSGYLLPWTQLSYWAATVGTSIPGSVPFLGDYIVHWIRGGPMITGRTLGRFFAMHVMVLPGLMAAFMGAHFLMIRKSGISEPL